MAGPVWRRTEGEIGACDSCLTEGQSFMVEGTIEDGELIISRRLCETCYDKNSALITKRPAATSGTGD